MQFSGQIRHQLIACDELGIVKSKVHSVKVYQTTHGLPEADQLGQ